MAAMELDQQPSSSEPAAADGLPTLSLDVLQIVKDAQGLHGLKHSDYERYRQYCTRRLRRIYKSVKFLHGRGRYQKKKLEPEGIKDVRHLHIPLVQAERAWAYAMDLKSQLEQKMVAPKRQHLVRRLSKAARHAGELVALTAQRCDARTQLEAEAYSLWMAGSMLLEKESDWEGALGRFLRARKLFEELAKVGSFEQQSVCKHFLDQVDPTIRYCQYQISRKGGAAPDASELLDSIGGGGSSQLQSKLASLASEAQAQRASATSSLSWAGETYPVCDEKIRIPLHTAQELVAELEAALQAEGGELEARVALYDRCINAFGEARAAIKSVLQLGQGGADSEQLRGELVSLDRAVQGLALERTIQRNLYLAADAEGRFARTQRRQLSGAKGKAGEPRERAAKSEDVVRLYDVLVANVLELNELAAHVGGAAGEMLMDDCTAKQAHYQAARCCYVAHSFLAADKYAEAQALFSRATERCKQAASKYEDCSRPDVAAGEQLQQLEQQSAAFGTAAAAEVQAVELREKQGVQEGLQGMTLEAEAAAAAAGKKRAREDGGGYMAEELDVWEAFVGSGKGTARICRVPPALRTVPVRPIVLDTALNYIAAPSLQHRLPKKQQQPAAQGTFSRLFSGWR